MSYKSIREYLDAIDKEGELKRLNIPIKCGRDVTELEALQTHLFQSAGPCVVLNNFVDLNTPKIPVLINMFGTHKRAAMTVGTKIWEEAMRKYMNTFNRVRFTPPEELPEPKIVKTGPCKNVIIPEDDLDLEKLIPHIWWGQEGPAFITNAVSITKDPKTGQRNVGMYRHTLLAGGHPERKPYPEELRKQYLASFLWWNPPQSHGGLHYSKAVRKGKPLQIAIASMCDPAITMAAQTTIPYNKDEYTFAGLLKGEPVELVKCETVDLYVPATAEWVFEGEVLVPPQEELIGPHAGLILDEPYILPLTKIKCVTHRKNPMWHTLYEGIGTVEHTYIMQIAVETEIMSDLLSKIPEIKSIAMPVGPSCVIVQLAVDGPDKPFLHFGKYVIQAVWSSTGRFTKTTKFVIVVGPDVNPNDMNSVMVAVASRVQPYSDSIINRSAPGMLLDASAPFSPQRCRAESEQIGIDATIKIPERFQKFPPPAIPSSDAVAAMKAKVEHLLS